MNFLKPKKSVPAVKPARVPAQASTTGFSSISAEELSRLIENKKRFDEDILKKLPSIQAKARQDAISLRATFDSIEKDVQESGILKNVSGSSFSIKG